MAYENNPFREQFENGARSPYTEPENLSAAEKVAGAMAAPLNNVLTGSFVYMFTALLVSGVAALITANSGLIDTTMGKIIILVAFIPELICFFIAQSAIKKNNVVLSYIFFYLYALFNGVTLSVILLVYQLGSITTMFFAAAAMFAVLAFVGFVLKMDLSKFGVILLVALIVIIITSLLNVFLFHSSTVETIISVVGLLAFMGLTMYDVQKIKNMAAGNTGNRTTTLALWGALQLYLDFLNIFLYLLRLFGKRK